MVILINFDLISRNLGDIFQPGISKLTPDGLGLQRDFDQLWLDVPELGGYFPVPGTLN